MEFIEPLRQEKKLNEYLNSGLYERVGIWFPHGLGDVIQFIALMDKLREMYPCIYFNMILQKGLNQEVILPKADLSGTEELKNLDYDLIVTIHFPVETEAGLTKSELCCKMELGIEGVCEHKPLPKFPNPLVALHFNITCLPHLANPDKDTAELIWNEVREAGFIPIESHFEHVFHNPVNKKFDFVDCTVRKCVPHMESLIGLLQNCRAFIGVVSGNFHVALSTMPISNIAFLQKEIQVDRLTRATVKVFDVKNYQKNSVKEWLVKIP